MSFSFKFSENDLSDDELNDSKLQESSQISPDRVICNPLDVKWLESENIKQPKWEYVDTILSSLHNVRLSFEKILTPQFGLPLYRRELFDIKHQLMSEIDDSIEHNSELEILMGETNEDLRKNIYEGGLKSWECSIDLVDFISQQSLSRFSTIIELGCGTSLPSEYLFTEYLKTNSKKGINFILSDYNESVLRLVTIPNLIISWAVTTLKPIQWKELQTLQESSVSILHDELLLTEQLINAFKVDLTKRNISINLISGTWGRQFHNLIDGTIPIDDLLILTSETIYHPDTLPIISETLIEIIKKNKLSHKYIKVFLAAKDIYFGVGGSIIEFENYMVKRIQEEKLSIELEHFKVNAGLRRSIIQIE